MRLATLRSDTWRQCPAVLGSVLAGRGRDSSSGEFVPVYLSKKLIAQGSLGDTKENLAIGRFRVLATYAGLAQAPAELTKLKCLVKPLLYRHLAMEIDKDAPGFRRGISGPHTINNSIASPGFRGQSNPAESYSRCWVKAASGHPFFRTRRVP